MISMKQNEEKRYENNHLMTCEKDLKDETTIIR